MAPILALLWATKDRNGNGSWNLAFLGRFLGEGRTLRAILFTLEQSLASTAFAMILGLPGAALVSHYRFPGRKAIKALSALPFVMPSILMVLAFVLFYGRSGYLNRFLMSVFGLSDPPLNFLYSFWGIVLVHGFYEFPIVLQTVGEIAERLPRSREDAARSLGASRLRAFITGSLPSLAPAIAQAAALAFLLCFFSFAVVMVLGGMAGSTLEVEVYRRARIEIDPEGATAIALLETLIAVAVTALMAVFEGSAAAGDAAVKSAGASVELKKPRGSALVALLIYALFLLVFLGGPLLSLVFQAFVQRSGPAGPVSIGPGNFTHLLSLGYFGSAILGSLATALPSAALATMAGLVFAFAIRRRGVFVKAAASLPLAISGIVASIGWTLIFPRGGLALIPLVQGLACMPYAMKSLAAALATLDPRPSEAARSLGAGRLRVAFGLELRGIYPALAAAFAFCLAASAGDVNVPLVLGQGDFQTLSVYLYRLTSAYRFPEACAAGLILGLVSILAFVFKEKRSIHA